MILLSVLNQKERGYSLTEFAIVLGVMGMILASLWGVVAIVRENMKRTEMKEQVYIIVNNVRDHYLNFACATANQICPSGVGADLTNYLLRGGYLPYEIIRDRSAGAWVADHPWQPGTVGGSMRVLVGADPYSNFEVELRDLNQDSCVALASKLTGAGTPRGLMSLNINGSNIAVPAAPEDADGPCNGADTLTLLYTLRAP